MDPRETAPCVPSITGPATSATPSPVDHVSAPDATSVQDRSPSITPQRWSQTLSQKPRSVTPVSLPGTSQLSSPPPTADSRLSASTGSSAVRSTENDLDVVSTERINEASSEELRSLVTRLLPRLQEARTDAAHYKLQYQMLTIESAETVERIQVEMDMAQRERDVLQTSEQQREEPTPVPVDPNVRQVHVDLYDSMVRDIQDSKSRNALLESTVASQRRMIVQQESEIASLNDRVSLLRDRLKENRDHLNRYRRIPQSMEPTPRSAAAAQGTPRVFSRDQKPFAALLHATDLMSQEPPRTPKRKRMHQQGPMTPQTVHTRPSHNPYNTPESTRPVHMKVPQSAPQARTRLFTTDRPAAPPAVRVEEGNESDGTVSAAEDSEAETEVPDLEEDPRASLLAAELLRTPTRTGTGHRVSDMTQTRIWGEIRKPGVQRVDETRTMKRPKADDTQGLQGGASAGR